MEKKEYKLSGMTCASCAMTVEMAVKDLETVEDVNVNLATERLSLVPKAGFDSQQVLDAVAEAGYQAAGIAKKETRTTDSFSYDTALTLYFYGKYDWSSFA